MPSRSSSTSSGARAVIALAQAIVSTHWEPTWNVRPAGVRPWSRAASSRRRASSTGAPNFDDSGNRLCVSSTETRMNTPAPGARRATLATSAWLSAANSRTPAAYVAATCEAGFTVLL